MKCPTSKKKKKHGVRVRRMLIEKIKHSLMRSCSSRVARLLQECCHDDSKSGAGRNSVRIHIARATRNQVVDYKQFGAVQELCFLQVVVPDRREVHVGIRCGLREQLVHGRVNALELLLDEGLLVDGMDHHLAEWNVVRGRPSRVEDENA